MRAGRLRILLLCLAAAAVSQTLRSAVAAAFPLPTEDSSLPPQMPPDLPHRPEVDLTGVSQERIDRLWQKFDRERGDFVRPPNKLNHVFLGPNTIFLMLPLCFSFPAL